MLDVSEAARGSLMLRCGRLCAALLLTLSVLQPASAADRPPADLRDVGGHWSAWNPPTSHPEGAKLYRVEVGDTLWNLAERFFGDPYLWPQLWERNRYVEDSHWIYPGDPLVIEIAATTIDEVAAIPDGGAEADDAVAGGGMAADDTAAAAEFNLDRSEGPPEALGSEDDIYCSGFIGDLDLSFERRIIGSEFENLAPRMPGHTTAVQGRFGTVDTVKLRLTTGDIVYLDGGSAAGLSAGELFTVVTPQERVRHPINGETVGRFYKYSGRVRVLSVQEQTAIGEIEHACEGLMIGAELQPFEPQPIPLARRPRMRGFNDPSSNDLSNAPTIVRSEANIVSLGQHHVVFIDRGSDDDIVPGDVFTIYRLNAPGLPPVVLGELGVLSVEPSTAMGRILQSRYSVHLGDRLEFESN